MRRILAMVSTFALAVGLVAATPTAAGQTTETVSFPTTCHIAAPQILGQGGPTDITPEKQVNVHVTAPEKVDVGQRFDVEFRIDPLTVSLDSLPSIATLQRASRLKLDLQRPEGARLVDYSFAGGNLDVTGAQIITVNEQGAPDPNGSVLRVTDSGHNTVGNGGRASTGSHAGLGMDLAGKKELDLRFPTVKMTFEAESAGTADLGIRTKNAASPYGANPASFLSLLASVGVPLFGTQYAPAYCSPRASATAQIDPRAAALKSVEITGNATTTTLTGPEKVYQNTPTEFEAAVAPVVAGRVVFEAAGQRVTAEVDPQTGKAKATFTFANATEVPMRATFEPANRTHEGSEASLAVDVQTMASDIALEAPEQVTGNERFAVTATLPQNARGTVVFSAGGREWSAPVREGRATANLYLAEPGEKTISARFTPAANSPFGPSEANTTVTVLENATASLMLSELDAPAYVGEPTRIEAFISLPDGARATGGTVEFEADGRLVSAPVSDGRAEAEYSFGKPGDVQVSATYHPVEPGAGTVSDHGVLTVVDSAPTDSSLSGPAEVRPGVDTEFAIAVTPSAASGTASVRIDGRVVAENVSIVDGAGTVTLNFPPSADTNRDVTVDFTPDDLRAFRPHVAEHMVRVASTAVTGDVDLQISGPSEPVASGTTFPIRVTAHSGAGAVDGYLTVKNNGNPVTDAEGRPVTIPVVRGIADAAVTITGANPPAKVLEFTFHESDGTTHGSSSITVQVTGSSTPGGAGDGDVDIDPGSDQSDQPSGSLPMGSLGSSSSSMDLGSLTGSLGSLNQTRN